MSSTSDFLQHKFDMIVAIILLIILCALMVHFSHDLPRDDKPLDWALHGADLVLGAIVGGLTVSRSMRQGDIRAVNENGGTNGSPNA